MATRLIHRSEIRDAYINLLAHSPKKVFIDYPTRIGKQIFLKYVWPYIDPLSQYQHHESSLKKAHQKIWRTYSLGFSLIKNFEDAKSQLIALEKPFTISMNGNYQILAESEMKTYTSSHMSGLFTSLDQLQARLNAKRYSLAFTINRVTTIAKRVLVLMTTSIKKWTWPTKLIGDQSSILKVDASPEPEELELKRLALGLHYRLSVSTSHDRGTSIPYDEIFNQRFKVTSSVSPECSSQLIALAAEWKTKNGGNDKTFNTQDNEQLNHLFIQYPSLVPLLNENQELRNKFFYWSLLTKNSVDIFAQYPHTVDKILEGYCLADRIGLIGQNILSIKEKATDTGFEKDLTLVFNREPKSILNESQQVDLSSNYSITIKEFFEGNCSRKTKPINFDIMADVGVTDFVANRWSRWNNDTQTYEDIAVENWDWIKTAPPVFYRTFGEVKQTFKLDKASDVHFSPGDHIVALCSSADSQRLKQAGSHTYFTVAIPSERDPNTYGFYWISCTAKKYPEAIAEWHELVFYPVEGGVWYDGGDPQERHHNTLAAVGSSLEDFMPFFKSIGQDIQAGRDGKLKFQYAYGNCTHWSIPHWQKALEHYQVQSGLSKEKLLEVFNISLYEFAPDGSFGAFVRAMQHVNLTFARFVLDNTARLFGAPPEFIQNVQWNQDIIVHPQQLGRLQEQGQLPYAIRVKAISNI